MTALSSLVQHINERDKGEGAAEGRSDPTRSK